MHDIEVVLMVLLAAVALFAAVSGAIGVPYPIVLVLGGLGLGLAPTPRLPDGRLAPQAVLGSLLPPLLYTGAFFASLRDLRAGLRTISLLAVGLVIATTCAVAVAAHALIDGLPWAAAFT